MNPEYDKFLDAVYKWGEASWMNQYFDLIKRMLSSLGINESSEQVAMTARKDQALIVNIGGRWVIRPYGDQIIGLILPLNFDESSYECRLDGYFKRNGAPDAKWVLFAWPAGKPFPEAVYHQWEQACTDELRRTRKSGYRKFHSDWFFDTVMRDEIRQQVLMDAYKTNV